MVVLWCGWSGVRQRRDPRDLPLANVGAGVSGRESVSAYLRICRDSGVLYNFDKKNNVEEAFILGSLNL